MSEVDWEYVNQYSITDWKGYFTITCPICGCGSHKKWELLYECLKWSALESDERFKKTGSPWDNGFYQSTAHELAANILDHAGLLEHGSGIGWAWITEDGKRLLALIETKRAASQEAKSND